MAHFTITKKELLPGSEFVIEGEIAAEAIEVERKNALEKFQHMFTIDGFRKGHIPEKILIDRVGELALVEEEGSLALEKVYGDIIQEVKISPIGQPKVSITKIAPSQPMGFKIEVAVSPDVTLPGYKKIAAKIMATKEEVTVDDAELDETLKEIQRSVAHKKFHETHGDTEHHNHDFKDEELPEVNDEFVKTLGEFENVEDFKAKMKASVLNEKQVKAREKKRLDVIEAIMKETKVEVPEVLVESELLKMIGQFKDSIASMGLGYDEYLKRVNKTEEDIRSDWKDEAKKRAIMQLVLNKIAVTEDIKVDEVEVKHEVENLLKYYKEADPVRIHVYVETMMTNEKVWKFLEDQN